MKTSNLLSYVANLFPPKDFDETLLKCSNKSDFNDIFSLLILKMQSCKLHNKYMIASTQITSTEIFAFIAALVFNLWHCFKTSKICRMANDSVRLIKN